MTWQCLAALGKRSRKPHRHTFMISFFCLLLICIGVDDDYVDPFDARLRIAMRGEETSPPIIRAAGNGVSGKPSTGSKLSSCSSKQSSSSLRKEPVDMYEDPYDARRQKPSLAKEPSDTYEDPFDTAARNKRFSPPSQASDADSGVYNQPHDIKGAGLLPPCSSEEGNYMDPFDAKKPKKVSPMPIRKVSKVRVNYGYANDFCIVISNPFPSPEFVHKKYKNSPEGTVFIAFWP